MSIILVDRYEEKRKALPAYLTELGIDPEASAPRDYDATFVNAIQSGVLAMSPADTRCDVVLERTGYRIIVTPPKASK